MKYFLSIILIISLIYFAATIISRRTKDEFLPINEQPRASSIPMAEPENKLTVSYNQSSFTVYYSLFSPASIEVIPNFTEKESGEMISNIHSCRIASNGGFYTVEDTPLGLLKINGEVIGREKPGSNLINGFVYIDTMGNLHIDSQYPSNVQTVIQTGPYITSGQSISTVNDKPARRVVLFESNHGEFGIAAVTSRETTTSGPYLADLPLLLFSITEPFRIERAINLDGGAASFYRDESGFVLSELTHVGSVLCVK